MVFPSAAIAAKRAQARSERAEAGAPAKAAVPAKPAAAPKAEVGVVMALVSILFRFQR